MLLDGQVAGAVYQDAHARLRFRYETAWQTADESYPLSLSMPLTATEHDHAAVEAYLWGLLPDNEKTLDQYARTFGVSARNPVALLAHIGADCAGAVQLVPPDHLHELQGEYEHDQAEPVDEREIARELRSARETGLAGKDRRTVGQFSLAGAQPKIALHYRDGQWGRPMGRTPTTHILKPPSPDYAGFAENEHLCLDLAGELGLRAANSMVRIFDGEVAIVVARFDRLRTDHHTRRVHQEDVCQALTVLPWNKYESDGGPGVGDVVSLLEESSLDSVGDVRRFLDILILNWVLAATDAHAKNYSLLHLPGGGVRLAPFYDIASYLPYADQQLYEVKLAMRVGREYLARRVSLADWKSLAAASQLSYESVLERLETIVPRIPDAVVTVRDRAISDGLPSHYVEPLATRIIERSRACAKRINVGRSVA